MHICIVGGALQGMEAVSLSKALGMFTTVIDRDCGAPALSLANEAVIADVVTDRRIVESVIERCDAVIPANEDEDCLKALCDIMGRYDIPFLFDPNAYRISSSKIESNSLMSDLGLPIPRPWPECGYPAVVKPSSMSGSVGVSVVRNDEERIAAEESIREMGDEPVVQEYVSGINISVEVTRMGGVCRGHTVTEVVLDGGYDCKMVKCGPALIPKDVEDRFRKDAERIADAIDLHGIMDLEGIFDGRGYRLLEIDARIPSQTPLAILVASGPNLIGEMIHPNERKDTLSYSIYEHYTVKDGYLYTNGEKEFSKVGRPRFERGLFGTDYAITDYSEGSDEWRMTAMYRADSMDELMGRHDAVVDAIIGQCGLKGFVDGSPEEIS
ncbi:MAG: 3-methylornithine--L-lysine ligase PylC [Candidatus Methanomethylophilaceae archaeon]